MELGIKSYKKIKGVFFVVFMALSYFVISSLLKDYSGVEKGLALGGSTAKDGVTFSTPFFDGVDIFSIGGKSVLSNIGDSSLGFVLSGVLINSYGSAAFLEVDGSEDVYVEKEAVLKNVYLEKVYRDYVLINNDGVLEKISLSEGAGGKDLIVLESRPKYRNLLHERTLKRIDGIKREILRSPLKIFNYVRFSRARNGQGVKLWPKKELSVFKELGFEPGDILIGVNGKTINEIESDLKLAESLRRAPILRIEVMRGDSIETVELDIT